MDEMYLKMILALTDEFFDGWEWNAGDRAILLDDHYKREVLVINTHYQIISSRVAKLLFPGSLEGCKTEEHITRLRPLPSQEQLQKMLIDFENKDSKYKHSNYFIISERFIAVVIEGDLVADMENKTLTEMWLEFVVYLMRNKTWNGTKWIKNI